jgi:uncharacterized protein YuzE
MRSWNMPLSSSHDLEADALYVTISSGPVARTVELDNGTLADLDLDGRPVGLEVIHPRREWPIDAFVRQYPLNRDDEVRLRLLADSFRAPTPSFRKARKVSSGSGRLAKLRPLHPSVG